MIVTEIYNGQGLGNQLWCYVVTRVIAKNKGYDFGIKSPEKFKCNDFLSLDLGQPVTGGTGPEGGPPHTLPNGITHYYSERKITHPSNGRDIRMYDKNLVDIPDNTKIDGIMQDEQYIVHRKDEIRQWLKVKEEYECYDFSNDDTCVINFRGGEYVYIKSVFLLQKYWDDAVENMRKINKDFKFIVITDDVVTAKKFFPKFDVFHFGIAKDYAVIKNAKYLILSNSSFAFFPAWLNENLKFCIAPKYWSQHNTSDGFWSCGYNITTGWSYQDQAGKLQNYDLCLKELNEYMANNEDYFTKTLDEIALSLSTDKSSLIHNYTKLYSRYFDPIRHEKLKILEIGIDKGYSLKSWREYFEDAEITGIDILDVKKFEEDRIHIEQGDQRDTEFLKRVNKKYGPFDIIIDDGSHHNYDMLASFECLFPLLKEDGYYVVEDLHACYWGKTHGTGEPVFIDKLIELIDCVNSGGKSGVANIARDEDDGWYNQKRMLEMTWWEKNIEFLHLYRSIVFIKKYPKVSLKEMVIRQSKRMKKRLNSLGAARKIIRIIKHKIIVL